METPQIISEAVEYIVGKLLQDNDLLKIVKLGDKNRYCEEMSKKYQDTIIKELDLFNAESEIMKDFGVSSKINGNSYEQCYVNNAFVFLENQVYLKLKTYE